MLSHPKRVPNRALVGKEITVPTNMPATPIEAILDRSDIGAQYNQMSWMHGNVTPSHKPCSTRITMIDVTVLPNQGINSVNIAVNPMPRPKIFKNEEASSAWIVNHFFMRIYAPKYRRISSIKSHQ